MRATDLRQAFCDQLRTAMLTNFKRIAISFFVAASGAASATNVQMTGTAGYTNWGANTVVLNADRVENYETGGNSGTLYLKLSACNSPTLPATCYEVASYRLGELSARQYYYNISSGTIAATNPPNGTYHMLMQLVEYPNLNTAIDYIAMSNTVTIGGGGGGGGVPDDYGNSISSAYSVSPNSTTNGRIGTATDVDFFRIRLTAPGQLALRTSGTLDTVGRLYNSSGTLLASNDDGCNSSLNFCLSRTLSSGTYYVRVNGYSGRTGAYSLVSRFTPTSDDYGNTRGTARLIAPNSTTSGRINSGVDVDYFKVQLSRAGTLAIRTRGSTDTVGTLYNAAGTRIGSVSDDNCGDETLNFCIRRSVAAGTYYLKIDGYGTSISGPYSLVSTFR